MKRLGKYAIEREKRILEYLYNRGCKTRGEIQIGVNENAYPTILVDQPLADLMHLKLVLSNHPCPGKTAHYWLSKKAQKWVGKQRKREKQREK